MCIRKINSDNKDSHSDIYVPTCLISQIFLKTGFRLLDFYLNLLMESEPPLKAGLTLSSDIFYCKDMYIVLELLIIFRN